MYEVLGQCAVADVDHTDGVSTPLQTTKSSQERTKMDNSNLDTELASTATNLGDPDIDGTTPSMRQGVSSATRATLGGLRPSNRRMVIIGAGGSAMLVVGALHLAGRRRAASDR
jgi:hypothetical protein